MFELECDRCTTNSGEIYVQGIAIQVRDFTIPCVEHSWKLEYAPAECEECDDSCLDWERPRGWFNPPYTEEMLRYCIKQTLLGNTIDLKFRYRRRACPGDDWTYYSEQLCWHEALGRREL